MLYNEYAEGIGVEDVSTEEYNIAESVYMMLPDILQKREIYKIRKALGCDKFLALCNFILELDGKRINAESVLKDANGKLVEEVCKSSTYADIIEKVNPILVKPIKEMYADIIAEETRKEVMERLSMIN